MIRRFWGKLLWFRHLFFHRHRHRHLILEQVGDISLLVLPDVFNPALFRSSEFLANELKKYIKPGMYVLDMGTGSGISAISAAKLTDCVTAADINPEAVRCARINVLLNHMEDRVRIIQSDLFSEIPNQCYDLILFNPPFYKGQPKTEYDHAWRSETVIEEFACELSSHFTKDGFALVILSTDGDTDLFLTAFKDNHLNVEIIAKRDVINEVLTIYKVWKDETTS